MPVPCGTRFMEASESRRDWLQFHSPSITPTRSSGVPLSPVPSDSTVPDLDPVPVKYQVPSQFGGPTRVQIHKTSFSRQQRRQILCPEALAIMMPPRGPTR